MKLSRSNVSLGFLKSIASQVEFALYQSDDDRRFISCFVARFPDNESCEKYWRAINNEIAIEYQPSLPDEFSSWNIYLALVTPVRMDKHLKYRLENDRFALRKIVLTGANFTSDEIVKADLEKSILGSDLRISTPMENDFSEPDELNAFREFLSARPQLPLDGKEGSSEIRRGRINELLERLPFLS